MSAPKAKRAAKKPAAAKRPGAGRQPAGWGEVGRDLARLLAEPPPPWLGRATRDTAAALLAGLRHDALLATAGKDTIEAPGELGVSRAPYMNWRAAGGWLSGG